MFHSSSVYEKPMHRGSLTHLSWHCAYVREHRLQFDVCASSSQGGTPSILQICPFDCRKCSRITGTQFVCAIALSYHCTPKHSGCCRQMSWQSDGVEER
jgi:hypothetical protein